MRIVLLALLALAACDETAAVAPPTPEGGGDVAMKAAAAKECAQMTGYSPEKLPTQTAEMQALVMREYNSCVARVTGGD